MATRGLFDDGVLPAEVVPASGQEIVDAVRVTAPESLVAMAGGLAAAVDEKAIERAVVAIQKRSAATKRLKAAMLSLTTPLDWVGQEKKLPDGTVEHVPYLQGSGAVKVFHPFAIEVNIKPGRIVPYDDGTFEVVYDGAVRAEALGPNWMPIVGSRWSGDPFFAGRSTKPDPGDVRKAALTNWYQNAIVTIAGLDNMTWDDLKDAGIDIAKVRRVTWESRGSRATASAPTTTGGEGPPPVAGKYLTVDIAFKDDAGKAKVKAMGARWAPTLGIEQKVWALPDTDANRMALDTAGLKYSTHEVAS